MAVTSVVIETGDWTIFENQLLYSALHYAEKNGIEFNHSLNKDLKVASCILNVNGVRCFMDYSDQTVFMADPALYDYYFKRSLLPSDYKGNVHPLNLMVNLSYKPFKMLASLKPATLFQLIRSRKWSEIIRAVDVSPSFTNLSHHAMDVRRIPTTASDNGGRILYMSRLWNPDNHPDPAEQERRWIQTQIRIDICRSLKKHFPNAISGLFPDELSKKLAPDLLLKNTTTTKYAYLKTLRGADICIADDGLGNTPGWKIGEYLMFGKAVITTPISIVVENLTAPENYLVLEKEGIAETLPLYIERLMHDKQYLQMGIRNRQWSNQYLWPEAYFKRILDIAGQ